MATRKGDRSTRPLPAVVLETPTETRCAEFIAAVRRSRHTHRPWVRPPETPAAYELFVARASEPNRCSLFICRQDGGELVAVANLSEIVRGSLQSAYLGYYLFQPWEGQGYMQAGLRLALTHAFGPLKLHRVEANIQPDNPRSIALVRRLGFQREGFSPRYLKINGRWRDHERWAILAEDWRRLRSSR